MWRLSNHDIEAKAQEPLAAPQHGRVGPVKRPDRNITNPSGCVFLILGWMFIGFTFLIPYAIGTPNSGRLTFGTDYNSEDFSSFLFNR